MTYAANLAALDRTPQWLVYIYMTRCDNHYTVNTKPNLLLRSEDLTNAAWVSIGTPIITADAFTDSDGIVYDRIEDDDAGVAEYKRQDSGVAAAGKTVTLSVMARRATPGDVTISVSDGGAEIGSLTAKVGATPIRLSVTKTFTGGAVGNMFVRLHPTDGVAASTGIADFSQMQLTEGSFALAYQKTVAATAQTSICTATDQGDGARCCYSVPTCQDIANFKTTQSGPNPGLRLFKFCLQGSPLVKDGVLPLLKEPTFLGQEIDPAKSVTIRERVILNFLEDTQSGNFDADKLPGLTNTSTTGHFWRRFREIYRNYSERRVVIKTGFIGDAESEYQTDFDGLMKDFKINSNGTATIEVVSKLSRVRRKIPNNISDTNTVRTGFVGFGRGVPFFIDVEDASEFTDPSKLSANAEVLIEVGYDREFQLSGVVTFTEGSTSVTGSGTAFVSEIGLELYNRIWAETDDEMHAEQISSVASQTGLNLVRPYTGKGGQARAQYRMSNFYQLLAVDVVNRRIQVQGGVWTTPNDRTYAPGIKIREVIWLGSESATAVTPEDAIDSAIRVLRRCGIPEADINVTALQAERDLAHSGTSRVDVIRLITEEIDTSDLLQELQEIGLFNVFQDGTQITGKAYYPPLPNVALPTYDEASGFIAGSQSVEDNDEDNRLTRTTVAFDKRGDLDGDKPGHYFRIMTRLNATSESASGYGDRKEKTILSKNLARTGTLAAIAAGGRTLQRFRDGAKSFPFSLELKDAGLKLGDFFVASTSRIQTVIGATASRTFQVIKKKRASLGKWDFEALEAFGAHRVAFIGSNALPADYDSATSAERKYAFIGDSSDRVGNAHEDGYYEF